MAIFVQTSVYITFIEPFLSFGEASRKYFLYFIIGFKISDYILT